jgi:O-antigen/teichoic acid export membrane protein
MKVTVKSKAVKSSLLTILDILGKNGIRFISNLILTRILYPEAFGLMALAQVFLFGLQTFSDIGLRTSVIQSKRGDEVSFLDTAWTLQVVRGFILWLGACILAFPASNIYDEPLLALILPVLGLSLIIDGFKPTKEALCIRHLNMERLTLITLTSQIVGVVALCLITIVVDSVWGLVFGTIFMSVLNLVSLTFFLPGRLNKFKLEKSALTELVNFGKFIFLSTACSFLMNISDRAILGAYVDISLLGVYAISLVFASLPGQLTKALADKVIFPLYRIKSPIETPENQKNIFKMRRLVAVSSNSVLIVMSFWGVWIIDTLYDERYSLAGPMIVLFAFRAVAFNSLVGGREILNACGDSKRHFQITVLNALSQVGITYFGVVLYGIAGAILAPALSLLIIYPIQAYFTSKYKGWDPVGELGIMFTGFILTGLGCYANWGRISVLIGLESVS